MTKWITLVLLSLFAWNVKAQFETGTRMISGSGQFKHQTDERTYYFSQVGYPDGRLVLSFNLSSETFRKGIDAENKSGFSNGTTLGFCTDNYWARDRTDSNSDIYDYKAGYQQLSIGRFLNKYYRISGKFAYYASFRVGVGAGIGHVKYDYDFPTANSHKSYETYDLSAHGSVGLGLVYRASERFVFGASTSLANASVSFNKQRDKPFSYGETAISGTSGIFGGNFPSITASYVLK